MKEFKMTSNDLEILKSLIGKEFKTILSKTLNYELNKNQFELYEYSLFKMDNKFISLNIE